MSFCYITYQIDQYLAQQHKAEQSQAIQRLVVDAIKDEILYDTDVFAEVLEPQNGVPDLVEELRCVYIQWLDQGLEPTLDAIGQFFKHLETVHEQLAQKKALECVER